jgi:hypothetical protein
MRIPEIHPEAGRQVYYIGSLGTVTEANDDGTYTVELVYGETVRAWPSEMAYR